MGAKDVLYTATTAFVAKGRPLLASGFDMAGDVASLFTYGVGGVEVIQHGLSLTTLLVILAMCLGSLAGTYGGMALAKLVEHRLGVAVQPKQSRADSATDRKDPGGISPH